MAVLEVCCGLPESVDAAAAGGAQRIELCTDLEADGLTPPVPWIRAIRAKYPSLTVHVLIRPRAGDFCYTSAEADTMAFQVESALEAGADGIVLGALTPSGDVDLPLAERLVALCRAAHPVAGARRTSITFHRAFDVCRRPFEALEQIIGLGCDRLLTSGQGATVVEGSDMLRELHRRAAGRLIILPGGGVTPVNAARILSLTGCTEIHASASAVVDGRKVTSAETVAAILRAVR